MLVRIEPRAAARARARSDSGVARPGSVVAAPRRGDAGLANALPVHSKWSGERRLLRRGFYRRPSRSGILLHAWRCVGQRRGGIAADGASERFPARFRPHGLGSAGSARGSQSPPGPEHAGLPLRDSCGRASASGEVEIANAGHCPPLVVRSNGSIEAFEATGLPLGLAAPTAPGARYAAQKVRLDDGDSIVLYTDGITEAANAQDHEYGDERLRSLLGCCGGKTARELVTRCLADLSKFLDGNALSDDLTILALQRSMVKPS